MLACGVVNANDPVGIEVRKRNAIGLLALVKVQLAVKTEADGTAVVSFQAPETGTYFLNYTSGPAKGKVATRVRVEKPGPVTTKVKSRPE